MNARGAIRLSMQAAEGIWKSYLADLTDAELLVRPVEGANHIAWQLGHLIAGENWMMEQLQPGSMPPLPAGFNDKYKPETAGLNNASAFCTKDECLQVYEQQRAATLAALDKMSDADLDRESPEKLRSFAPTVAHVLDMQSTHYLMHAGQWAVIRRKLGRKPLF